MSILKRPPGDLFTFRQFVALTSQVKTAKDSIYLWSAVLDPTYEFGWWPEEGVWRVETELDYRNLLTDKIKSDLVILGVKDHLTAGNFDYWNDKQPAIVKYLADMFEFFSDKKFILFTSVEGLSNYINLPNVRIIPWGGDITNHQQEYQKLEPILDKNLDSQYSFLSLNRNKRIHRARLLALLYGLNVHNTGLISCMFKETFDDTLNATDWRTNLSKVYEDGSQLLKLQGTNITDDINIYRNNNNDNVTNFKNLLAPYYKDTFVEIISETSFTEECFNLTEKTLHSIYGCCFPILLCSKHSVKFLRDIGLDVFDDVVNHSYDEISDPAKRLETAILDNIELLVNVEKTKVLWTKHKERFEKNIDFCKERLYNYYNLRSKSMFNEILNDY